MEEPSPPTLADDGHCVQASSLDAGVCVEDAADWRGAHRRRCLPSLAVILWPSACLHSERGVPALRRDAIAATACRWCSYAHRDAIAALV